MLGTILHYLARILVTVAAALLLYYGAKIARKLFTAYQEIFVMYTIAFGRRWMPESRSLRIQPFFCKTKELDDVSVEECFRFHIETFGTTENNTKEAYLRLYTKVLLSYSHILLCRDRLDGSLRGLILMGVDHRETHTILKVGMMTIHRYYRGGPWWRLALTCMMMTELILHPRTPLYIIGKLSTYKTYLAVCQLPETYPRYDKETPEHYKKIAEEFAGEVSTVKDTYDRDTLVLRRRVGVVQGHLAAISERDLSNPHIKFFNDRNPGWKEGDQLVTLMKLTWGIWFGYVLTTILRQLRQPTSTTSNIPRGIVATGNVDRRKMSAARSRLRRGNTFQDSAATIQAMRYQKYEYWEEEDHENRDWTSPVDHLYSQSEDEELNVDFNI